jgi:hypothetical protein
MRSADVLLLLHGTDPICSEYIPSKLYEYLWMQRPILALVHENPQMVAMLSRACHRVVRTDHDSKNATEHTQDAFSDAIRSLLAGWQRSNLDDDAWVNTMTTGAAVEKMLKWSQESREVVV